MGHGAAVEFRTGFSLSGRGTDGRSRVHVVAGALIDEHGRVLLQRRAATAHQGGLWEFPGGKLEAGETREAGLCRELEEELGVHAEQMRPLICVPHDYSDRRVLLDVWRVDRWRGDVRAMEQQPLAWAGIEDFARFEFPAADRPVLSALRLPELLLITPPIDSASPGATAAWWNALRRSVDDDVTLVQIRSPRHSDEQLRALLGSQIEALLGFAVRVLINAAPGTELMPGIAGVHLNSTRLWDCRQRPLGPAQLLGASCHTARDLDQAARIGVDYAVLGPVTTTASHPGAAPMGWSRFADLVAAARVPVYALGGMSRADVGTAQRAGAQGIAAISALWRATA